jgi:hypothetical protein
MVSQTLPSGKYMGLSRLELQRTITVIAEVVGPLVLAEEAGNAEI